MLSFATKNTSALAFSNIYFFTILPNVRNHSTHCCKIRSKNSTFLTHVPPIASFSPHFLSVHAAALLEEQLQYMGKKAVKIQRRSICVRVLDAGIAQSLALFGLAAAFALHRGLLDTTSDDLSVAHVFTTVCALV